MAILRITAVWSGFRGAPGYSNFYFAGGFEDEEIVGECALAVRDFFDAFNGDLPSSVTISVRSPAEIIDEASGEITGQVDFDPPTPATGNGGPNYSAASGAVVNWNTAGYRNGRRIRGRTFLVPLTTAAYDPQGDISTVTMNRLRNGAAVITSGVAPLPAVVWSRPVNGAGGSAEPITGATIPDLGAILRSRRD